MGSRSPRRPVLALALTLGLALVGAACGGDDDDATATTTTTTAGEPSTTTTTVADGGASTTTATTATTEPADDAIVVEIAGGEPVGGAREVDVAGGDEVTLRFVADTADEAHVHCYDLFVDVGPDAPGEVTFTADIPGQCEVELHDSGAVVLNLRIG